MTRDDWKDISTAPQDGSRFLAWALCIADEEDDDGRVIQRGVRDEYAVVAYYAFGGICEFPFRNSFPTNVTYLSWQPLPDGPAGRHA